ncbi:MAG TPA: hypothetical protein VGM19_06490 [Armatimonadota bacterium]|jgi:hypothetical protein
MNNNSTQDSHESEGRVLVYGTDDPVAAAQLMALLADLDIEALQLTRPDVYPHLWPQFPGAYQVLVPAEVAEARREEIDAALAELQLPAPDEETTEPA